MTVSRTIKLCEAILPRTYDQIFDLRTKENTERIGSIYRLTQTRIKQNDDHTHIMRKTRFRSSFKILKLL